jgi:hypothetical protein
MKTLMTVVTILALATSAFAQQASQQDPQKSDPPKSDQKADKPLPSIAGKWLLAFQTQQGAMNANMDLKLDGKKVTGTMSSQQGESPITGEFADGKLTFTLSFNSANGAFNLACTATQKPDDTLEGNMDGGQFQLPFTATRVKDK